MKIKEVEIKAFRGIENFKISLNDKINVLEGKNGIGKTTIIDSILWVLSDETLIYGKQDADNRDFNNLKKPINVILTLDDGTKLERKYYDVWKQDVLGEWNYVKTENKFFINDIPYKKGDYIDEIKTMLNLDRNIKLPKDFNIIRSVVDYNYFWSIDYKISRAFLENVLKLKSDLEMVSTDKYAKIKDVLTSTKFDLSKTLIYIKNECEVLEKQINDTNVLLNDLKSQYSEDTMKELVDLYYKRDLMLNENVEETAEFKTVSARLEEINKLIKEEEKTSNQAYLDALNKINSLNLALKNYENELTKITAQIYNLERDIEYNSRTIDRSNEAIYNLKNAIDDKNVCPNCGYVLNQKEIDEREEERKEKIEYWQEKLKEAEESIEKAREEKEEFEKYSQEIQSFIADKTAENDIAVEALQEIKTKSDKQIELEKEKEEKKTELEEIKDKFEFERKIAFNQISDKIGKIDFVRFIPEKIKDLQDSLYNFESLKFDLDMKKDLIKEFKKEKLATIKKKTSEVFPDLDIEIIEENENTGNLKEVCYAKLKEVEFKGINDGNKKIIGIITIENIKETLGLNDFPIIFDKAGDLDSENLAEVLKITKSQILATKVSDSKEIING